MRRYLDEGLPAGVPIAVVANDAIGNFVVATPLLQMLREQLRPSRLDYFGGTRTGELQTPSDLIDWSYPLHGTPVREAAHAILCRTQDEPYGLVVNVEGTAFAKAMTALIAGSDSWVVGPCLAPTGRGDLPVAADLRGELQADPRWIAEDLPGRYPFLDSGFIGEIFCRLAYLRGPIPGYRVPKAEPDHGIPDVLIATAASLPEKLWPWDKWSWVLTRVRERGLSAGLIGAAPSAQREFWTGEDGEERLVGEGLVEDLRGAFSLPQVVGALGRARACLSIDNGVLHLAVAAKTPTVGLYRNGINRLWAPPSQGLTVLVADEGAEVSSIEEDAVWGALENAL
ncbi:MAG: hypothetical protein HY248_06090 [Fimbriimonas ginsengisoli]|uniref:Glycosyltransferase family 9 protein n=1 Tax=Fimbriimonas ginsengisoli TaxID=1005039 RepID=A0A931PVF5_FIMGI|nr:hypothetical protein [Fimbriimonas ginsengisoli]MBI3722106.1 hypothetical protein [Fimbriimonas ginsengisoli]